jgi:hypothetical protein
VVSRLHTSVRVELKRGEVMATERRHKGELSTDRLYGLRGDDEFSVEKLLAERAEYFVFGVGGPTATLAFHVIGEIFDRVYHQAAIGSLPATNGPDHDGRPGRRGHAEHGRALG